MSLRDKLRSATVGAKREFPSEKVEINDGLFVEVKALTYGDKKRVQKSAITMVKDPSSGEIETDFSIEDYEMQLLIAACFEPGTDTKVFEEGDIATFREQPAHADHWLARLIDAATELNAAGNLKTQSE